MIVLNSKLCIFRVLLHHGASSFVNCVDARKYTPLFGAVKTGSLPNMILLMEHGADVNHIGLLCTKIHSRNSSNKCISSETPLFQAKTYETVKLLLKHGADPNKKAFLHSENSTSIPMTAIEYIMKFKSHDAAKAILDECLIMEMDDLIIDFSVFEKGLVNTRTSCLISVHVCK